MNTFLKAERRGDVLHLTLDDAGTGNLLSDELGSDVAEALLTVASDVKMVRLASTGDDFCLGRRSPAIDRATATAADFRDKIAAGPLRLYAAFRDCPAPILGLVQGRAFGVGCALAALCDLTVASTDAQFSLPEMSHGIPPTLVLSALADRLSPKAISHLVYTQRVIGAMDAQTIGIIGETVPLGELADAGEKILAATTRSSALALRGVKEFMRGAARLDPQTRTTLASTIIANVQASQGRR